MCVCVCVCVCVCMQTLYGTAGPQTDNGALQHDHPVRAQLARKQNGLKDKGTGLGKNE